MAAALYVDTVEREDEANGPPQDGMAYLRQVIKERKRVPDTVTAEFKPQPAKPKHARVETAEENQEEEGLGRMKVAAPAGCSPGAVWQREQVRRLSEVRTALGRHLQLARTECGPGEAGRLPDKRNEAVWCHMLAGGAVWGAVCQSRQAQQVEAGQQVETGQQVEGEPPRLQFLAAMPVHLCEQVGHRSITTINKLCFPCRCWSTASPG